MAIRNDFTAGEVLAAADLNDTFGSRVPFAYGTATPTTTTDGFIFYDENLTPPAPKFWDGSAFQSFGGGKILQIIRATNATNQTTSSTSFVDITGLSVTITPQQNTSTILIFASVFVVSVNAGGAAQFQITDASNNAISGAEQFQLQVAAQVSQLTAIAYATPATTSAVTYKLRFRSESAGTNDVRNATNTGQIYAIEVSA
jgi:hypothetical protein